MLKFISALFIALSLLAGSCSRGDIHNPVEKEPAVITSKEQEREAIKNNYLKIEEEIENESEDEEMPEDLSTGS